MSVSLQAVVSLDASRFTGGLNTMTVLARNATQAMMAAFGGLGGEILALSRAFGPIGSAVGVFKQATESGAEFQASMASLRAETGFAAAQLDGLAETAKRLSTTMPVSGEDIVKAMRALHAAGASTADEIRSALVPALQMAALAEGDATQMSDRLIKMLRNFGLSASDAAEYVSRMGAATSPAHLNDFSDAMLAASQTASAMGISFNETAAIMGTLEEAGIQGSQAGKQFAMVLDKMADAARNHEGALGRALAGWRPAAEGFVGALTRMQERGVKMEEVFQQVGPRSAKSLIALANGGGAALRDLTSRIGEGVDVTKRYGALTDTLPAKISKLTNAFRVLMDDVFTPMSGALGRLVDATREVVQWLSVLTQRVTAGNWSGAWQQVAESARRAFGFVREHAVTAIDWTRNAIANADWGSAWAGFKGAFVGVVNFVYGLRTAITDGLTQALSRVDTAAVKRAFGEIGDTFRQILPQVEASFISLWNMVKESGRVAVEFIKEGWRSFAEWLAGFDLQARWDSLTSGAQAAADWIRNTVTAAMTAMAAELSALLATIPAPMRDGFSQLANSLQAFGTTAAGIVRPVVDLFTNLGTSILTAGQNSGILTKVSGWLGSLADSAAHVVNVMTSVARMVRDAVSALATLAGSDAVVTTLEVAFRALGLAVDGALAIVHGVVVALDGLARLAASIPAPVLHIAAAIAGGAGLCWALQLLDVKLAAAIARLRTFIAVELLNLRTQIPALITQFNSMGSSMGSIGKAGLVAGAAIAGWELGKLIREIPGVAAWCDKLADSIWRMTGMMVDQDPALEARVKRLKAEREEQERQRAATNAAAAAVTAHTTVTQAAVTASTEAAQATDADTDALLALMDAAHGTGRAVGAVANAVDTTAVAAQKGPHTLEPLEEAFRNTATEAKGAGQALMEMGGYLKDLKFEFNVQLPKINQYQVDRWWEMTRVFARLKDLKFEFNVQLPKLNQYQVDRWWEMTRVFARLKDLKFEMNIQVPHLTDYQVKQWAKFMGIIRGGGNVGLQVPKVPDLGANLDRIAAALDKLVAMKGIIWA